MAGGDIAADEGTAAAEAGLRRDIGFTGSAFLAFNGIVGAGIFALPATLHLQFGAFSPWLFPLFALLILLVVIPFAKLAALFAGSGGPVAYCACFGPAVSFQAGWLYYLARLTALAANANVFATYAAVLWPPLAGTVGRAGLILALVALVAWLNVIGVRRAIQTLNAVTVLKALPVIGLALLGLAVAGANLTAPAALPSISGVEAAALVILYAFVGFENSLVPAGETRSPQRTIPRALVITIVATAALYFVVQLAYVAVMPAGAAPEAPLAAFAEVLIGPIGLVLLSVTAMLSVAGNFLGSMTSTPRVTFALAEAGSLPRWFGRIDLRSRTPANSVLFMAGLTALLALTGSFVWLAIVSTLSRLFVYALSIAALPAARRKAGLRTGIGLSLLMAGGLLVCAWAAAQSTGAAWALLGGLLLVGLVLYALARRQASSSSAATVSSIQPPPSSRSPS
ncbi:MAG: APC family permease [Allosphingosinicella sp.]|uniref:APC family permease n=1 Tax=Allosphingosinicella sp. TaxID=2823234 RepID=UPI00392E99AA